MTFMLERIEKETGVKVVPSEHIVCIPCDRSMGRLGGFSPELGIILLCQDNKLQSKKRMEDTLTHELVHFYDHCKFNVNWMNLRHVACSEVSSVHSFLRCCFFSSCANFKQNGSKHQ